MKGLATSGLQPGARIEGFDLARALAFLGMVFVNFRVVLATEEGSPRWLTWLDTRLDGRASATFVILAGVGLSLLSRRARETGDRAALAGVRRTLFLRAAFLFVIGLLYWSIWPADILHYYGVFLAVGALLLTARPAAVGPCIDPRRAVCAAARPRRGLQCRLGLGDADIPWLLDAKRLRAQPDLQWVSPGRSLAGVSRTRDVARAPRPEEPCGLDEAASDGPRRGDCLRDGVSLAGERATSKLGEEDAMAVFGTTPMPPMPLYMLAASGTSIVVIVLCVRIAERFAGAWWLAPLVATGQLALTLYVAHVVIGLAPGGTGTGHGRRSVAFSIVWRGVLCGRGLVLALLAEPVHPRAAGNGDAPVRPRLTRRQYEEQAKKSWDDNGSVGSGGVEPRPTAAQARGKSRRARKYWSAPEAQRPRSTIFRPGRSSPYARND